MSSNLAIVLAVTAVLFISSSFAEPWDPIPQPGDSWLERHEGFVNYSKHHAEEIKVVFIGSSSIERWGSTGLSLWNSKYAPVGCVNFGIGGDKTENVIWRIDNGELDGLSPKFLVVYIGSNNIPTFSTPEEVERGVLTVIERIHDKLPESNILYLGFFPRGDRSNINETWTKITTVNEAVQSDTATDEKVSVLNIFWDLAESWGVLKDELYSSDKLHLSKAGYEQWDISMNESFYRLLQD